MIMIVKTPGSQMGSPAAAEEGGEEVGGGRWESWEKGPKVVIWESLSEQEKVNWLEEASTTHDWVTDDVVQFKKRAEEIRLCELSGKEIFFSYD